MARPKKDNADYFPHESGMRNDDRIKALRKKFKLNGYAIWNMVLEYLSSKDFFQFEYNEFTLEIIAGDFDAEVKDIQEVISYCLTLGLLQQNDGFIRCSRLEKGLEPLLSKRKRERIGVIANENPQSKGEESKEKESKEEKPARPVVAFANPFVEGSAVSKAWSEWEQYRKEKKQKLTPSTVKKQIQFLGGRGDPEIIEIINQSITNGWTGLFEIKNKQNNGFRARNQRKADAVITGGNDFGKL